MAAMSATAAMPVSRTAQFAPKRATKARVVRRGVIAAAGKRGTQPNPRGKNQSRCACGFALAAVPILSNRAPRAPPAQRPSHHPI